MGDDTRGWGPPFAGNESAYFLSVNRNKKSLTLDLKKPAGVDLLGRLAGVADVLVENFRPGTMDRLGLGDERLRTANPKLVFASLSGFGSDGPMSDWPCYDLIIQAWGGLMSITGTPQGEPTKVGVALIDVVAGLMLGQAITAALYSRQQTGTGQKIETSLLEAGIASLVNAGSNFLVGGKVTQRHGNAHPSIVPYQSFKTQDGFLVVAVASETIWKRFCPAVERPELATDPRFERNALRVENRDSLIGILEELFLQRSSSQWMDLLRLAEVPCAPVQTIDQVFRAPQVLHRQMVTRVEHPTAGQIAVAGSPLKFSDTPPSVRLAPPLLGQHNREVLGHWLGMKAREIEEMQSQNVI